MKKLKFILVFIMMIALSIGIIGCTKVDIVKAADGLYLDIRTVVTDPEVKPMISGKTMAKLADLERKYLIAAKALKNVDIDKKEPLTILAGCAEAVLDILDGLDLGEEWVRPLATIRIAGRLLKNHIQLE